MFPYFQNLGTRLSDPFLDLTLQLKTWSVPSCVILSLSLLCLANLRPPRRPGCLATCILFSNRTLHSGAFTTSLGLHHNTVMTQFNYLSDFFRSKECVYSVLRESQYFIKDSLCLSEYECQQNKIGQKA